MEEKELQQRFHLLQQEVEAAISLVEEGRLNYAAAVDALKIEARCCAGSWMAMFLISPAAITSYEHR
jgi:hypothetical protein